MGSQVEISGKKNINLSNFRSCYHRLANRKKLILPLEKQLQNFKRHYHWHCWHKIFRVIYNFSKRANEIMMSNYGYLMLPGAFPDIESYPWYWFCRWSNSSVLCSSCKNTFVGAGNLQVITNRFWCENLWRLYVLCLDAVFCIYSFSFLSWSI